MQAMSISFRFHFDAYFRPRLLSLRQAMVGAGLRWSARGYYNGQLLN